MNTMKKAVIATLITAVTTGTITVKSLATNEGTQTTSNDQLQNIQETSEQHETVFQEKNYKITKETNLYSIPSFSSADKTPITENTIVIVENELNNWMEVSYENTTGWILKNKVEKVETTQENNPTEEESVVEELDKEEEIQTTELNKIAYIGVTKANIREKNSIDSAVIGSLLEETEITLLEEMDGWYKIKSETIAEGYISKDLVTLTKPVSRGSDTNRQEDTTVSEEKNAQLNEVLKQEETKETANSAKGESVVAFAKQYIGYNYVSGGKSPSTGFDCSGFTSYVYKNFGISLGASAASQANVGTAVDKSNLQPGDLLVFQNSGKSSIGHVGIYMGNGQMVHAANAKKGVTTISIHTSYYAERFVTARRIID